MRFLALVLPLLAALALPPALAEEYGPARPVAQRDLTLTYEIQLTELPPGAKRVSVFLPLPASTEFQLTGNPALSPESTPHRFAADETYGNRFLILDLPVPAEGGSTAPVAVHFDIGRRAYRGYAAPGGPGGRTPEARWLAADPLTPIDGKVAAAARAAAGEAADPIEKARRVYDALLASSTLDAAAERSSAGDGKVLLEAQGGGPKDLVSLLVAELRSLGVPARYVSGWPLPRGEASGAIDHDEAWAEIHLPGKGWLPVDVVAAERNPEHAATFFGAIDLHRIQLTVGREIAVPGYPGPVQDIVAWPLAAVDGVPVPPERVRTSLRFVKY